MRLKLLPFLLIVYYSPLFGQQDSTRQQILNYRNPDVQLIANGRLLLAERFLEGDKEKVKEILNYLITNTPQDRFAFYPAEELLLHYWVGQYKEILVEYENKSNYFVAHKNKVRPPDDGLADKLFGSLIFVPKIVYDEIEESLLSLEEKRFLKLNLHFLIGDDDTEGLTQEKLNQESNLFLNDYPGSRYSPYVRNYIRQQYAPSKWGMGFEFFIGNGSHSNQLNEKFTNSFLLGVAFDILYKNWVLYLRDCIGLGRTRMDIPFTTTIWDKGSKTVSYFPEASLGYNFSAGKRVILAPFVGLTSLSIGPTQNDERDKAGYDRVGLNFTTSYTTGLNCDFKVTTQSKPIRNKLVNQYVFIRIRYAYNLPQFDNKYVGFSGNVHCLTIGAGSISRNSKRVY